MYSSQEIETQLTQRRVDVEDLQLKVKQANARITQLNTQLADTQAEVIRLRNLVDTSLSFTAKP